MAGMTVGEQPTVECDATGLIQWANEAWCTLCEFDQAHVAAGCRLSAIQGPGTDLSKVALIMKHVQAGLPISGMKLINYSRSGRPFHHTIDVQPLGNGRFRSTSHLMPNPLQASGEGAECLDLLDVLDEEDAGYQALDDAAAALDVAEQRAGCTDLDGMGKGHLALLGDPMCILTPAAPQSMTVVTDAYPPFAVRWASDPWMQLCGFQLSDVVGGTLKLIQGPATDHRAITRLSKCPGRHTIPRPACARIRAHI
jgi:hypothetical protein